MDRECRLQFAPRSGVFIVYVILVHAIQYLSGVPYTEFFATAENAWRSANISLVAGGLMLLVFVFWSRWDGIWKDPVRLPMTRLMWVAPIVFIILLIVRLGFKLSDGVALDLLLAVIVAGFGVGLAEKLLFRGVILRALRTNGRKETWVMVWCALWFGMMHSVNVLVGSTPSAVVIQEVLASLSGVTLYLLRRSTGLLIVGIIAHGMWDISTFLPAPASNEYHQNFGYLALALTPIIALVAGVAAIRHDRRIAVIQDGILTSDRTHA